MINYLYINEHGQPIERTPQSHPYNYDGFVLWRGEGKATQTAYSDRLGQQDYKKTDELKKKHFGNISDYWNNRKPENIENFLSEWLNKPIKLVRVMEYCNQSNGYPYYRFDYYENK